MPRPNYCTQFLYKLLYRISIYQRTVAIYDMYFTVRLTLLELVSVNTRIQVNTLEISSFLVYG